MTATTSKPTPTRIYKAVDKREPDKFRLVRASHPATVVRHVTDDQITVTVADGNDFEAAISKGIKVEHLPGAEQLLLPTGDAK